MLEKLEKIAEGITKRMDKANAMGTTVTLKVKYNDFTSRTRSKTCGHYINSVDELMLIATELLRQSPMTFPVRLLGLSVSNLNLIKEKYCGKQCALGLE